MSNPGKFPARKGGVAVPYEVPSRDEHLLRYLNPSTPQPLRYVANKARWPSMRTARALARLEKAGVVERIDGGWVSAEWWTG